MGSSVKKSKETKKNAKAEEMRQLKDLFGLYDTDNSGSINKEELKLLMNSLGFYPSVQMAEKYKKEEVATPHKGLRDAFNVLDKDNSNTLNPEEFRAVVTNLGEKPLTDAEVDEIVNAIGLERGDEIPIEKIIELFSME